MKPEDYQELVKVLYELFHEKNGKIVLLLDEIQSLKDWEGWIRTLHSSGKYYIFITGSSSKLASREIATNLRGRYISKLILPYSFREFLAYRKFEIKYPATSEAKGKLLKNLREYLTFGGFPDVVKEPDEVSKLELLRTYRETIFYRDVVERYRIRDVSFLENFMGLVLENFGRYFSLSKTENYFKSLGLKKSKKTLSNYLKYLEDAFFMFSVPKFGYKTRVRVQQPVKVYPVDTGFYKLMPRFSQDIGVLMESAVAICLFRKKHGSELDFFYWKDYQQNEVDFVVKQGLGVTQLIQVTYADDSAGIEKREINALLKAGSELNCTDLLIITWDYEGEIEIKNKRILCTPLWKWLTT
ncbi:AAA domain protein [uncultured archaeon]|nr:AAA domain protein [uncultured archaeon]